MEIIKRIKSLPALRSAPILIVSAKASEIDRVIGLDTGADDYLVKPFGVLELVSRIKALLRRTSKTSKENPMEINGLKLDPANYNCEYDGKEIILTKKQFELLKFLMENHNQTIERNQILEMIWGYDFVGESRTLDVHIKELRKKLKGVGINTNTIETIRGVGYKFIL